ncbi:carbohydrate-binding domain-containing protein [Cohnella hashimotonis]|uniref:Carbohydrate-binding domain-containing protein n=1 Tax=Cohnella hashimotonis TaxID=2826895 RepID=A0ABT6TMQ9_9BACL|nr:carbohydrate-binding domain-containing protein [Cohnella hashimotonis]MDI4647999.1 carbohydrate-binding domain-containing protein [Cohnella hashimotonis]
MKLKKAKTLSTVTMAVLLSATIAGCSQGQSGSGNAAATQAASTTSTQEASTQSASTPSATTSTTSTAASSGGTSAAATTKLDTSTMFSDRDLAQTADLTGATQVKLESGNDVTIDAEGVYVLSGEATNATVTVEAPDDAKVQLVLDGVSIVNADAPAIYVKAADKVFVTSADGTNHMEVTGTYAADGETNLDAVIFSRSDLTLNGTGTLDIVSKEGNGISSKDDLKITGGVYSIQSAADSLEANDSILINDGAVTIDSGKDGLHSENADDATLGYIYMKGGTLNIAAADDGIQGTSLVQIDGGTINITKSEEGIEANYILVNDGQITLYANDDGINAAQKAEGDVAIVVNGGTLDVTVGSGDTDAFDSNGDLYVNGGTIKVTAPTSSFDADGTAQLNGGDVTVNGEQITEMPESHMGGGGGGGRGGMRR